MKDGEAFKLATSAALRFISYRARSEAEVRTRLLRRFPIPIVDLVLADLTRKGLIDDSEFATLWKQSRDAHRPRSAFLIRRELLAKGVARDVATQAVADLNESDAAYRAGQKFARRLHNLDFNKFSTRLWGHLRRRGFNGSISRDTVSLLWSESRPQHGDPAKSDLTYPPGPEIWEGQGHD